MNHDPTADSRNCSIDIFRLLFAVYVVALHTVPASLDSYPFLSITVQSLFRFSVPFFLMVSGYYFFKKAGMFTWKEIGLYLKRLVITYSFWSCLYFIVKFISWGYQSPKGFLFDCVYSFFLTGSYYHLWYFPALIFSVCISALFVKAGYKKTLFCVSICAYLLCYLITNGQLSHFIHVDAMSAAGKVVSLLLPFTQGLFYFVCGLWIHVLHSKYASMQKCSNLCYILPISVVLWFILIWCNHFCSLGFDLLIIAGIYLNVGLIIFVLLLRPLPQYSTAARKCRYLANFMYYSHPLFIFLLGLIRDNGFPISDNWYFPITLILTIATGMFLYRVNSKHIHRVIA